jgi:beta-carotene 15,15'-dioxygenase
MIALPWRAPPKLLLGAVLVSAAAALLALDRLQAHAGLIVLIVLVGTVGTVHGVLDALLMARHLKHARSGWWAGGLYLLATIATALVLQPQPGLALMLLLGLSIWHFGERFDHLTRPSLLQRAVQRWVRGGAPVLMPALVARPALEPLLGVAAAGDAVATSQLWAAWSVLAGAWLFVACGWLLWAFVWPQREPTNRRQIVLELGGVAALYLLVSPLMAFALYFGVYHAGGHILRVLAQSPAGTLNRLWKDPRLVGVFALTLLLGALLVGLMQAPAAAFSLPDVALRSVILALAAISIPHVLLITWWARVLSAEHSAALSR